MTKYIDKDNLVKEIKRRMNKNSEKQVLPQYFGMVEEDLNILSFIDTLEVKGVNMPALDNGDMSVKMEHMDYERKYKKALKAAAVVHKDLERIFPELKESEDERIRKGLIEGFQQYDEEECWRDIEYLKIKDIRAWLEKQGNANKEYWKEYREGKQEILDKYSELEKNGDERIRKEILKELKEQQDSIPYPPTPNETARYSLLQRWMDWLKQDEKKSADNAESTTQSYITPNQKFFQWIYDRLIYVHNENPNVDYMLSLKERIKDM